MPDPTKKLPARPIVLIHGYSDSAKGFAKWRAILNSWGLPFTDIYVGNYVSLSNEVTVKDVAEGFDRALAREAGLPPDSEFDAIVHSTGMLVVRAWLNSYSEGKMRRARLKHLIALAPATNGSPLAHQGRSWLGSIFKGSKKPWGPDFMEAGDEILYGLELGSKFSWDLAQEDLIADNARFRPGPRTPFVFTFCGNKNYGPLENLVTEEEGTDGTVRWAGCALNSRKINIDLTVMPGESAPTKPTVSEWANQEHPLILIDGIHHGTILTDPPEALQHLVKAALLVDSAKEFTAWVKDATEFTQSVLDSVTPWQQFVIRVIDERGDPVNDWNARLMRGNSEESLEEFGVDVHVYKRDPSLRCFHVNLEKLDYKAIKQLHLRLIASSGTNLVVYHGAGSERVSPDGSKMNKDGKWDAKVNLSKYVSGKGDFNLFFPFTTTFIEIRLNREPMPMVGKNDVYWFK